MSDLKQTRILIVDDHPLVRESLTTLIQQHPEFVVCGEAATQDEAMAAIEVTSPDLAIVDISLSRGSGLDLVKNVKTRYPDLAIIVLSMHDESIYAERVVRAGARGYVMKKESTRKVIDAIRHVMNGEFYLSPDIMNSLAKKFISGRPPTSALSVDDLSDRELEVFRLLGQGYETREIASSLDVSIKTIQTYCARIKEKLRIRTGTELLREAIQWTESGAR
ncbi:MAG TPA: response regulator transcription factor [Rhizomicrobium sp.]|jgi:DNA-binding NarL/FixJ family response regulator|nr:response regulator transcription factor [Rhizomicrobium sp.]